LDRIEQLAPPLTAAIVFVGIGDPLEGLRVGLVIVEEAIEAEAVVSGFENVAVAGELVGMLRDTLGWAKIIPTRLCPAACSSHRRRHGSRP
jgi:hypothetical protein